MTSKISGIYDQVQIEDLDFDVDTLKFYYPCPCGDKFIITLQDIKQGEEIAKCPSCSLTIKVIYDPGSYEEFRKLAEQYAVA